MASAPQTTQTKTNRNIVWKHNLIPLFNVKLNAGEILLVVKRNQDADWMSKMNSILWQNKRKKL